MKEVEAELEGPRVLLRKLRASDASDIYLNINNRDIARWTIALPYPYPKDEAAKHIRKMQRLWRTGKTFAFGIVLKETARLIGNVNLARVDQKHKCAEMNFWIGKKYWRQGLATQAARLALNFGFKKLKLHRIYAAAFEPNVASRGVLKKCGFTHEGTMRQAVVKHNKRHNFLNYGILKSEFNDA